MAERSSIEWCDHTWTPVVGCDAVSPACANCYAALMAARLEAMGQAKYAGLAIRVGGKAKWTGKVNFHEPTLEAPLTVRKPGRWFLTSMGDVAHERVTDEQVVEMFSVMAAADWHTFLVLTKRTERMATLLGSGAFFGLVRTAADRRGKALQRWPLRNVFIGCTAEDQEQADIRRPHMAAVAALGWQTFVSYEPALGPVHWAGWEFLKQLISGGESGPKARPSHPDWYRGARDYAAKSGIAYLHKQNGAWVSVSGVSGPGAHHHFQDGATVRRVGKAAAGRMLDGRLHTAFPG